MSLNNNVGIFWDYENCAPSSNASGFHLIERIRQLSHQFGAVNLFKAYLQFPEKSSPKLHGLRSELQSCGVSLTDCPHTGKNSVDLMMIVDIMAFVKDNPAPATIILISGDRDFAYLLSTIRWRQYHVVLVSNTFMTHESLSSQANVTFDWQSDILKTRPHRPRRNTSISNVGKPPFFESEEPTAGSRRSSHSNAGLGHVPRRLSFSLPPPPIPEPAKVNVSKTPVPEEPARPRSSASSQSDEWVLTNRSPSSEQQPLEDDVEDDAPLSPIFLSAQSSPELVPSDFEGDIPSSPGYLLLIGDSDDSVAPTPLDETTNEERPCPAPGDCSSAEDKCECQICLRSLSSEGSVRSEAEPAPQELEPLFAPAPINSSTPSTEPELITPLASTKSPSNLNVLAPTFAPRFVDAPTPSSTLQPEFNDLVIVLNEMRSKGTLKPRFSIVAPLLLDRKPDVYQAAGVTQLKAYLQLAENIGIVSLEQDKDGDGWMCLRHPWHQVTKSPPASPPRPQPQSQNWKSHSVFHDLIIVLNELRLNDDPEPRFSTVAPRLLRRKAHVYELAGAVKFKDYIEAAVKAGVATVRGVQNGDGWVTLCDRWCSKPEAPRRPEPQPVQQPLSMPSAFQPLVSVLEDLRSKGQSQCRVSTIFSHLVWSGRPKIYELAGVATFKEYINAAVTAGAITIEGGDASNADASVSLKEPQQSFIAPIAPSPPTFEDLSAVLDELCGGGMTDLRFSQIEPAILARNPQAFARAGVSTIGDYMRLAGNAGIVPVKTDGDEDGWVTLRPPAKPTPPTTSSSPVSGSESSTPPRITSSTFRDLVSVLQHLRSSTGENEARFANVVPLLLRRKPNAYHSVGVTKFKEYIALAVSAGIVSIRGAKNGDGWISLCATRPTNPANASLPRPPPSSGTIPPMFKELVWLLRELRLAGEAKPLFSSVAPALLKNELVRDRTLGAVGALKFKSYAEAARDAGVITMKCERVGEERLSLCPAYQAGGFIPSELW